jgi:hypothetical protein
VTAVDIKAAARELVKRTTDAQGLPEQITDPAAIEQIAALLAKGTVTTQKKAS